MSKSQTILTAGLDARTGLPKLPPPLPEEVYNYLPKGMPFLSMFSTEELVGNKVLEGRLLTLPFLPSSSSPSVSRQLLWTNGCGSC